MALPAFVKQTDGQTLVAFTSVFSPNYAIHIKDYDIAQHVIDGWHYVPDYIPDYIADTPAPEAESDQLEGK